MKTFADYGIVIPAGKSGEIDVICPECSHLRKKKSVKCLQVNTDKGKWWCAHCEFAGGLDERTPIVRKVEYRRPSPPKAKPASEVERWFAERQIPASVLERNKITATTVYMPQVQDDVGAIAFPYFRGEELINVKYRDRDKNFRMEKGAELVLYGLNDIDVKRCVIVEGEIDKLSLEVAGITSCVSVPNGAPPESTKDYASKFTFLEADKDLIESVQEWIIAVDNDGPGKRLEDELARRLGRDKCKRVTWPSECKDANDVLRSFDAQTLHECIDHAQPYPLSGVFEMQDISSKVRHLRKHGWESGVATGWDELDRFYTVRPGEVTVVTGIPNSGKSNWVDALAVNLAVMHGWHIALFSPENQPIEDHAARIVEKYARAPFADGPTPQMSDEVFEDAMGWAQKHFTWILPDDENEWTIDTVLDRAKALCFRKGIRGLVIDPWNELEHSKPQGVTETDYVGEALRHIRQFARRNGIHVWLVVHPTKLLRDKDGKYPVPTLYDCAGSAHFRNKADNGICVWRDFKDDTACVEIHVQKIRFRQIGRVGLAKLKYIKPTASYRDLSFGERA